MRNEKKKSSLIDTRISSKRSAKSAWCGNLIVTDVSLSLLIIAPEYFPRETCKPRDRRIRSKSTQIANEFNLARRPSEGASHTWSPHEQHMLCPPNIREKNVGKNEPNKCFNLLDSKRVSFLETRGLPVSS